MLFDTHIKKLEEVLKQLTPPKTFGGKSIGLGSGNTNRVSLAKEDIDKAIKHLRGIK